MPEDLRIPFSIAISEPRLMGGWWEQLSLPQQVALKVMYGCELSSEVKDKQGYSELDHWAASQGFAEYDELGYITKIDPLDYHPEEYHEVWMITGVRAGKTDRLAATITAYEATCGGHEAYSRKGRPLICFQIAQDLRMAKYSLHSVKGIVEEMPFCKDWIKDVTADRLDLKNGITVTVCPPTVKSIRGYDSPVGVLDEVGVWYTEADSANPDFEIYRQVISRQAQFTHSKVVGISSPWTKQGLLFQRFEAGTNGAKLSCERCRDKGPVVGCEDCGRLRLPHKGRLVLHGTSAGLGNPLITKRWLIIQQAADPRAFERECLARFQDSISGFLDGTKVGQCIDQGVINREPSERNVYVAAMDPAFRRDNFAFAIGHMDQSKGVVMDVVKRWVPPVGTVLNPAEVLGEIAPLLRKYRCFSIYSDQYQFESLQQLALNMGFSIEPVDFTASSKADIYGNLKSLVHQLKIKLLDDPESIRELRQLEAKLSPSGNVQIAAPIGAHDDLATVIALVAQKVIWLMPLNVEVVPKEETIFDRINKSINDRKQMIGRLDDNW